jgi:hypothetical protein
MTEHADIYKKDRMVNYMVNYKRERLFSIEILVYWLCFYRRALNHVS